MICAAAMAQHPGFEMVEFIGGADMAGTAGRNFRLYRQAGVSQGDKRTIDIAGYCRRRLA
jgi:hypothetical protein